MNMNHAVSVLVLSLLLVACVGVVQPRGHGGARASETAEPEPGSDQGELLPAGVIAHRAADKERAGDAAGCLADLDAHDRLDPHPALAGIRIELGTIRARCLMKAGQCAAGKTLYREILVTAQPTLAAAQVDVIVERQAVDDCAGPLGSPREELLRASHHLDKALFLKLDAARCQQDFATIKRLLPKVKPTSDDDHEVANLPFSYRASVLRCLARAGDCGSANRIWKTEPDPRPPVSYEGYDRAADEARFAVATQRHCQLRD